MNDFWDSEAEYSKRIICYMDGIDWQHHLGEDPAGSRLYPTVENAKEGEKCVESGGCGVVEVEVRLVRWVEKQNLKY